MIQPSDIFTLTDFKRKSTELIEKLEASGRAQVLTVEGSPRVVIMAVDTYERMAAIADQTETVEMIRRGLEDVKAGRTTPAAEVFEEVRRRFNIPPSV